MPDMPRFPAGRILATPGALAAAGELALHALLERHSEGDWGDLEPGDRRANEDALRTGTRLLSAYDTPAGRIWITTEAAGDDSRGATTILTPEEY
jgi:hypothetical protein